MNKGHKLLSLLLCAAVLLTLISPAALAEGIPFPKRLGRPEDFAELALDIVRHGYLNGEVIRMDGALRMAPR